MSSAIANLFSPSSRKATVPALLPLYTAAIPRPPTHMIPLRAPSLYVHYTYVRVSLYVRTYVQPPACGPPKGKRALQYTQRPPQLKRKGWIGWVRPCEYHKAVGELCDFADLPHNPFS